MNTIGEKSGDYIYQEKNNFKQVNFYCSAPGANAVHLEGDFNNWRPVLMQQNQNGWWLKPIWFPQGHHQYRFLVDGELTLDLHSSGTACDELGKPVSLLAVN